MTANFVRRHLKCGKSRLRPNARFPNAAWFGVPASDHFVRCYPKPAVNGFRVEEQCNREFLLKHGISTAADIVRLPRLLVQQLGFYQMDWARLSAHVRRRPRYGEPILRRAREHEKCLNELLRFLRTVKVWNPERFLIGLPVNAEIGRAAQHWAEDWPRGRSSFHGAVLMCNLGRHKATSTDKNRGNGNRQRGRINSADGDAVRPNPANTGQNDPSMRKRVSRSNQGKSLK